MISVTRLVLPPAAVVLLTVLAAGCASSGSAASSVPPASHSAAAPASQAAASGPTATAAAVASAVPVPATPSVASPVSPASPVPSGADVYFAESQDITGTTAHAPACQAGCPLSGDGTTVLWNMTWPVWTGSEAVGTGTEKIDACDPDCAAGPEYSVTVTVTFTQPARDCSLGQWFWTYATFTWPDGLPSALSGDAAPTNPWSFTQVKATATQSCA